MKLKSLLLYKVKLLCLFVPLFFMGTSSYAQDFTSGDFIADLDYLEKTLPKKHINLFAKISPEEYAARIGAIREKAETLDADRFMAELYSLMVAIGDEHTSIEPAGQTIAPIRFGVFREGIFVTGIESSKAELLLSELTMVNGRPAEEITSELKTVVQSENLSFFNVMMPYQLSNISLLKGMSIVNEEDEVVYTLATEDGDVHNISFGKPEGTGMKYVPGRRPTEARSKYYWYKYMPEEDALYFNYTSCRNDPDYSFEQFSADMFEAVRKNHPARMIVDLRENGGGNSSIMKPFLDSLQNIYLNREGRLYVLIGKRTFSSALLNALTLKLNYKSVLLGEPTGGSINHYGEIRSFELPRTKATVVYSTKYFRRMKGADGPLIPDIAIPSSVEDLKNGTDSALDYIFNLHVPDK